MTDSDSENSDDSIAAEPISAEARRVLGVLVEKAKTTPDNYPLSVAAIVTGANQKSNRAPKMDLDEDDALLALDELRRVGAALEIQGGSRVTKYRHTMYEWMDIDGPQSAVMTELLLRGPQTVGELRTRASRMHAFADLSDVKVVLTQLHEKGLANSLTPPGRGQMFGHCLYQPQEQQHVVARAEKLGSAASETKPARSTTPENTPAIDKLLSRLDKVSERIDDLEKRIAELES